MRRYLAVGLLVSLMSNSAGAAVAASPEHSPLNGADFRATSSRGAASTEAPLYVRPLVHGRFAQNQLAQADGGAYRQSVRFGSKPIFAARARMATPPINDVARSRLAKPFLRRGTLSVVKYPVAPPVHRVLDPIAKRFATSRAPHGLIQSRVGTPRAGGRAIAIASRSETPARLSPVSPRVIATGTMRNASERMKQQELASTDAGAGINRFWTYENQTIPGVGAALLNVGTGNLVIQATDIAIPERGLDLVMQRTYNSQSLHDASGDDGSEPAIFGNGWTNTYDSHIVLQSNGNISVYDADGTRCDYTPQSDGTWKPCLGQFATLEPDPDSPCSYWLIKKNGTAYWFQTPMQGGCFSPPANVGRLYKIVGRNTNNFVTLSYSFGPGQQTTNDITEIDANHSDGQSLKMTFGWVGGTKADPQPPNEMVALTYNSPTNPYVINYGYDAQGDLQEVDRPGNAGAAVLPETYGLQHPIQFACGPRATIAQQKNPNGQAGDGACLHFDYDSSVRLSDWLVNGVLNVHTGDGFGVLQPGMPTGWQTWYMASFVYGAGQGTACGTTLAGTTTMCDSDGHSTVWTPDSLGEVTQTEAFVNASLSLVTQESWQNGLLTSFTDPRTHVTNYAYDVNGNVVAIGHPAPTQGGSHPTEVYAYDANNNLTAYCDPIYSDTHGLDWNGATWPGTQCPGGAGTTHYVWATPPPDPVGRLTDAYTACYHAGCVDAVLSTPEPGYHVSYSYDQYGEPTQVQGDTIQQPDGSITPTRTLGYDQYGNLTSYANGSGGTWTMNYDGLNQLTSLVDPDPGSPTSYFYYNPDGSVALTETPYQHSVSEGNAYGYDADGDLITKTYHRNNTTGTTTDAYDGLDRLVEVQQPSDPSDALRNPWETRYLYDLSEGATVTFDQSTPYHAYGNLFETQELLPQATAPTYSGTRLSNTNFEPLKGWQYDALNRDVGAYAIVNGQDELTATQYDGQQQYGMLTQQCKPAPAQGQSQLCKTFTYDHDGELTEADYNDQANTKRTWTYDFAGNTLTAGKSLNGVANDELQSYDYDLEGREVDSIEPNPTQLHITSPATYVHEFYPDGKLKQLDVQSHALPQDGLYVNSFAGTGSLRDRTITYNGTPNVSVTASYTYTQAGRMHTRTESGPDAYQAHSVTTWNYDNFGRLSSTAFPGPSPISDYSYDPEDDLLTFNGTTFSYTLRGELLGSSSQPNPIFGNPGSFVMANGVQIQSTGGEGSTYQSTWDARMGTMTAYVTQFASSTTSQTSYAFDAAGREANSESYSCSDPPSCDYSTGSGSSRAYDIDDLTLQTTQTWSSVQQHGGGASANISGYDWGPTDHPIRIGSADSTTSTPPPLSAAAYDTMHWDGDQLVFSTRNTTGNVDDIKIGAVADITPQDPAFQGITFWDRGPGGAVVYCHNKTGWSGSGIALSYPAWATWGTSACATLSQPPPPGTYPTSIEWFNGAFPIGVNAGKPRQGGVGQGAIVGMYRPDGFSDGANTIQGVRTTDSTSGQWTTPDSMGGFLAEPSTQKSYVWSGNNPMLNQDFSGAYTITPPENWIQMIDQCCGLTPTLPQQQKVAPLKVIGHVTSRPAARPAPHPMPPAQNPLTNNGAFDPLSFSFMLGLFSWFIPEDGGEILAAGRLLKFSPKIARQMGKRGWTPELIREAVENGADTFTAIDRTTSPPSAATGYVNPTTGQFVVVNNATGNIIQVGGPGFLHP